MQNHLVIKSPIMMQIPLGNNFSFLKESPAELQGWNLQLTEKSIESLYGLISGLYKEIDRLNTTVSELKKK